MVRCSPLRASARLLAVARYDDEALLRHVDKQHEIVLIHDGLGEAGSMIFVCHTCEEKLLQQRPRSLPFGFRWSGVASWQMSASILFDQVATDMLYLIDVVSRDLKQCLACSNLVDSSDIWLCPVCWGRYMFEAIF